MASTQNMSRSTRPRLPQFWQQTKTWLKPLCVVFAISFSSPSIAASSDKEKMAAVMAAVSILFSEEDPTSVELTLNAYVNQSFFVGDNFEATFESQGRNIELCFVLSSPQVQVSVNGQIQNGNSAARAGENCYTIPASQQGAINTISFTNANGQAVRLSGISIEPTSQRRLTLNTLRRSVWDAKAVRKVLKIFAFGGHATDGQINQWANMPAAIAIREMLNFSEHNLKLSPLAAGERYRQTASRYGKLTDFANFLSSPNSDLPIPQSSRAQYGIDSYNFDDAFVRLVTTRGLNPFRQRIGFWETNYHLAVNLDTEVTREQLAVYYDDIMEAHEAGLPYQEVIGIAAKSAAVAMQYGHRRNEWVFDRRTQQFVFRGNFDFSREIHQLFYGIFGVNDPNHEDGTIIETGKMLTDMRVPYISNVGFPTFVTFETDQHHTAPLQILGRTITGVDASQKIDNLMPISINHPESLANLPSMIIGGLADDNLTPSKVAQLNAAWASMGSNNKNLLTFLRAYATSSLFHSADQRRYLTSHERTLYTANKFNLDNLESFFGGNSHGGRAGRQVDNIIDDNAAGEIFRPLHNVFGGQTPQEAADSAVSFEQNYNMHTLHEYEVRNTAQCDNCDQGEAWWKKWPSVLPRRSDGKYYVADVAPWLWRHATGSLDEYSELERAHLYTVLGAYRRDIRNNGTVGNGDQDRTFDLSLLMCIVSDYQNRRGANADISLNNLTSNGDAWYNSCTPEDDGGTYSPQEQTLLNRVYTGQDIANDPVIQSLLNQMGQRTLDFDGNDRVREHSLERVNVALGFVFTTPFVFAEGQ